MLTKFETNAISGFVRGTTNAYFYACDRPPMAAQRAGDRKLSVSVIQKIKVIAFVVNCNN